MTQRKKFLIITSDGEEFNSEYFEKIKSKYNDQVEIIYIDTKKKGHDLSYVKEKISGKEFDNVFLHLHGDVHSNGAHRFGWYKDQKSGYVIQELEKFTKAHNFFITSCHCGKKSMKNSLKWCKISANVIHWGNSKNILISHIAILEIKRMMDILNKLANVKEITKEILDESSTIYTLHCHKLNAQEYFKSKLHKDLLNVDNYVIKDETNNIINKAIKNREDRIETMLNDIHTKNNDIIAKEEYIYIKKGKLLSRLLNFAKEIINRLISIFGFKPFFRDTVNYMIEKIREEIRNTRKEIEKIREEIRNTRKEIEKINTIKKEIQKTIDNMNIIKSEITSVQNIIERFNLRRRIQSMIKDVKNLKKNIIDISNEINNINTELNNLIYKNETLSNIDIHLLKKYAASSKDVVSEGLRVLMKKTPYLPYLPYLNVINNVLYFSLIKKKTANIFQFLSQFATRNDFFNIKGQDILYSFFSDEIDSRISPKCLEALTSKQKELGIDINHSYGTGKTILVLAIEQNLQQRCLSIPTSNKEDPIEILKKYGASLNASDITPTSNFTKLNTPESINMGTGNTTSQSGAGSSK